MQLSHQISFTLNHLCPWWKGWTMVYSWAAVYASYGQMHLSSAWFIFRTGFAFFNLYSPLKFSFCFFSCVRGDKMYCSLLYSLPCVLIVRKFMPHFSLFKKNLHVIFQLPLCTGLLLKFHITFRPIVAYCFLHHLMSKCLSFVHSSVICHAITHW